ncbi:MAG: PSD1 domain-containing protein [Verrucomicrobiaceae bacterium]|nr:PSD1 domain-containing protein [Verrucomicrobiaceae bacterium]
MNPTLPATLRGLAMSSLIGLLGGVTSRVGAVEPDAAGVEFFEKKVRPVLIARCYECHSVEAGKSKGGLVLDSREGLLKGGDTGPGLVAGNADKSLIIEAARYKNQDMQMPPKKAIPADELKILEDWVAMGAPDPRSAVASSMPVKKVRVIDIAKDSKHWAFQPVLAVTPPAIEGVRNPIDAFIVSRLRRAGLELSAPADKRTLIRRATFDLIGLPPTVAEVDAFLADTAPDAFAKVVERLLRSPHYGEKWGRHWLDVARYADSNGLDENIALGTAWRFRDYVVNSFNEDKPFDQFLTEQLAGDLLPARSVEQRHEQSVATAFLNLGAKVLAEPDKDKLVMDVVDEQIDVMGRAFMGMTFGCARCHDHKFDPIPQDDYYALGAIFKSTASFSSERTGAISYWFETPTGSLDDFAAAKAAELALDAKKKAVSAAVSAADKALKDDARAHAVDYLMAATRLPLQPTLTEARQVAEPLGLKGEILVNTRVYLAANTTDATFAPWHEAMKAGHPEKIAAHYKELFALVEKTPESVAKKTTAKVADGENVAEAEVDKGSAESSAVEAARKALNDPRGFLALPPEPHLIYPKDVAEKVHRLKDEQDETEKHLPDLPTAIGVHDADKILSDLAVHIRGNHMALGKLVSRGVPQVMQVNMRGKTSFPKQSSGRLELAQWLTSADHPLTSRVLVNRVWAWHFGKGIVGSVDNFGMLGDTPSHPELLDWLSRWVMENGWSLKDLHRLILTSAAWQQGSAPKISNVDPENKLLSFFPVRRLEAEEVRDALLQVAGKLDLSMGGKTVPLRNRQFVFNHTSMDATKYDSRRRALYLPIIRNNLYDLFQQFDYPDPAVSTGLRSSTVVSPQALLLMNSPLSADAAQGLAARVDAVSKDVDLRLRALWKMAYARDILPDEVGRCRNFLVAADASLASSVSNPEARDARAWELLCQAVLMASEFIYLR